MKSVIPPMPKMPEAPRPTVAAGGIVIPPSPPAGMAPQAKTQPPIPVVPAAPQPPTMPQKPVAGPTAGPGMVIPPMAGQMPATAQQALTNARQMFAESMAKSAQRQTKRPAPRFKA